MKTFEEKVEIILGLWRAEQELNQEDHEKEMEEIRERLERLEKKEEEKEITT
jgi:hypothetical protein